MNQRDRHQYILESIQRNASVRAEDLASALDVSIATIRRDFSSLEDHGRLLRTYGGAVTAPSSTEQSFQQRTTAHQEAKNRIAIAVLPMLLAAKSVILDAGTTTACLAERIPSNQSLLVVTNGLNIMDELRYREHVELVALGGAFRRKSQAFLGDAGFEQLSKLHVDVCFLGAFGLDPAVGITSPTESSATLKTRMVAAAQHTYILADTSKFHKSFAHVSPLEGRITVVTDRQPTEVEVERMASRGWALLIAGTAEGADRDNRGHS